MREGGQKERASVILCSHKQRWLQSVHGTRYSLLLPRVHANRRTRVCKSTRMATKTQKHTCNLIFKQLLSEPLCTCADSWLQKESVSDNSASARWLFPFPFGFFRVGIVAKYKASVFLHSMWQLFSLQAIHSNHYNITWLFYPQVCCPYRQLYTLCKPWHHHSIRIEKKHEKQRKLYVSSSLCKSVHRALYNRFRSSDCNCVFVALMSICWSLNL